MKHIWFSALFVLGVAAAAAAQQPSAPSPAPAASPLVVEKIENGWLFAPDARVADLDGRTGALAGAYGGRVIDKTILVGGGGYWMTNGDRNHEMGYGGAVVEWMPMGDRRIGFGVRSLVGGGMATMPVTYAIMNSREFPRGMPQQIRFGLRPGAVAPAGGTRTITAAVRDDFFVFEPQANLLLNLARHYRVSVGVGYRVIGGAREMNHQLEGLSGAVSLRIWGS